MLQIYDILFNGQKKVEKKCYYPSILVNPLDIVILLALCSVKVLKVQIEPTLYDKLSYGAWISYRMEEG